MSGSLNLLGWIEKMNLKKHQIPILIVCSLFIIGALTYVNYQLATASPGGVDFMTHWVGTRALFHGESPYSKSVALRVQTLFYGRPAQSGENEFLDPYLIYMEVIFAPFALISDYTVARAVWMTFLGLSTIAIFILSLKITDWKPGIGILIFYLLYCVFGYHSVRPIINGNVTTVITLLILTSIWAIQNKKEPIAGLLMAVATAKPNLTLLPMLLLILWMVRLKRWRFIVWFSGSLLLLVLGGMLIIPNWPLQNLGNLLRYTSYNPPTTIAAALEQWNPVYGHWIGVAIYTIIIIFLIVEWRKVLRADFQIFLSVFSVTLVANQWLGISTDPGNFIILTLPLVLVLKSLNELPNGSAWVCTSLSALLIGLWVVFLTTVDRTHGNLQSPIMFFPLPIFIIVGLFFRRHKLLIKAKVPVPE